ncbi:MAG TPA: cytidine deaminase [Pirellulales bacterium]|jgi:cytidine deaminase|nr:cytidine deaminase [Pirellulales bacterium]
MTDQQRQQIIEAALAMRERAYAPYSRFRVGAAVLTASGKVHVGCNVENASFGLTLCAERVALAAAVAAGDLQLVALAVALEGGGMPCGACRQFAAEFRHDLPVLVIDAAQPDRIVETNLSELLPKQFQLRQPY